MRRGVNGEFSNDIFNLQRGEECEVLDFSDIREEGVLKFVIGSKEVIKLKDWMRWLSNFLKMGEIMVK